MFKKILKKILKITGIVIGVVVLIVAGFYTKVYFSIRSRMNREYDVTAQSIQIRRDAATLELGGRLIKAKGCADCHKEDMGGGIVMDDPMLGLLVARNLTKGKGGVSSDHDITDWVLALKHGIRRDKKPLIFMPSHEYTRLSEEDLGAIIAYCTQLPPVDRELPQTDLGPLAKVLGDIDKLTLFPAEKIDHSKPLVAAVKVEVSVEYGKYLSAGCVGCHREHLKGGDPLAPGLPPVADITSSGHPGKWTDEQFINTLRTGNTPEGKILNPAEMPWKMTKEFTDVELKALHLYLKSI
jgi:mono/diheme cytochrome c family protein